MKKFWRLYQEVRLHERLYPTRLLLASFILISTCTLSVPRTREPFTSQPPSQLRWTMPSDLDKFVVVFFAVSRSPFSFYAR